MVYLPRSIYCYCARWCVCPMIQTIDESRAQLVANLQEQTEELAQLNLYMPDTLLLEVTPVQVAAYTV